MIPTPADGGAAPVRLGSAAYCYHRAMAALDERLPVARDSAAPGSGEEPRFGTENGKPSESGGARTRIRDGAIPTLACVLTSGLALAWLSRPTARFSSAGMPVSRAPTGSLGTPVTLISAPGRRHARTGLDLKKDAAPESGACPEFTKL